MCSSSNNSSSYTYHLRSTTIPLREGLEVISERKMRPWVREQGIALPQTSRVANRQTSSASEAREA